jgi:probable rRNA maturation factor
LVILQKKVAGLSENALQRFVWRACRAARLKGTVNVLVTSSATVRSLNREFRGRNQATDVLSFPASPVFPVGRKSPAVAGEVVISGEIAAQNAAQLGHGAAQEVKILALHGILHLAGFDHERDNSQMARKETKLRQALKLPVALIERTEAAGRLRVRKRRRRMLPAGARSKA